MENILKILYFLLCQACLLISDFGLGSGSPVSTTGLQIDPVIALLPWTPVERPEQRVKFTLHAFGGCFEWTSQRPDLIEIFPVFDEAKKCSTEAIVAQRAPRAVRDKAWVFARDKETQIELRCQVYVAPIVKIIIDTPSRSIGVQALETLSLRGYDELGNVFSSLERLWFKWTSRNAGVLSFASLNADVYRASPSRLLVQEQGGQPDVILLKGVSSGRSLITASLDLKGYPSVPSASVELDVSEPLFIDPPFIRAPPYSEINFGLRIFKPKLAIRWSPLVSLPSPNFSWKPESTEMGHTHLVVNEQSGRTVINTAKEVSEKIFVVDSRIANNTASAVVAVSPLSRLGVFALWGAPTPVEVASDGIAMNNIKRSLDMWENSLHAPFANVSSMQELSSFIGDETWVFVKGQHYFTGVSGYDNHEHELYLPINLAFHSGCAISSSSISMGRGDKFDCGIITPLWSSRTERFVFFNASSVGRGTLEFKTRLSSSGPSTALKNPLIVKKHFVVVEPIGIRGRPPSDVQHLEASVFPPAILAKNHSWTFEAVGGSGRYTWSTSNSSVVSISGSGAFGKAYALTWGITEIRVRDISNFSNIYVFSIVVAPVSRLLLDPQRVQSPINQDLEVAIRAFPSFENIGIPKEWQLQDMGHLLDSLEQNRYPPSKSGTGFQQFQQLWTESTSDHLLEFHFLNCSNIDSTSVARFSSEEYRPLIVQATASGDGIITQKYIPTPNSPHRCGSLHLSPQTSGIIQIVAHVLVEQASVLDCKRECILATINLEIFNPLAIDFVSGVPWQPVPFPATDGTADDTEVVPITISVGSSIDVSLKEGPSSIDSSLYNVVHHIQTIGNIKEGFLVKSPEQNMFQITCIQDETNIVLVVAARSTIVNSPSRSAKNDTYRLYMPSGSESTVRFNAVCSTPSRIEVHAEPNFMGVDVVRPLTATSQPTANNNFAEIFVRCSKTHRFGLFIYGKNGLPIHRWNYLSVDWEIKSTLGSCPAKLLENVPYMNSTFRDIVVPKKMCQGEIMLTVSLKWNLRAIFALLDGGPLYREKKAINSIKVELKRLTKDMTKNSLSRWSLQPESRDSYSITENVKLFPVALPTIFSLQAETDSRLYFFHPHWARRLTVHFGSGYFRAQLENGCSTCQLNTINCRSRSTELPSVLTDTTLTQLFQSFSGRPDVLGYLDEMDSLTLEKIQATEDAIFLVNGAKHFTSKLPQSFCNYAIWAAETTHDFALTVRDERLLGGEVVSRRLRFSKIAKIQIKLGVSFFRPTKEADNFVELHLNSFVSSVPRYSLELHSIFSVTAEIFDSSGVRFSNSDFPLMRMCLRASGESSGIRVSCLIPDDDNMIFFKGKGKTDQEVLDASKDNKNLRFWNAVRDGKIFQVSSPVLLFQGLRPGSYELRVSAMNFPDEILFSNALRIDVFEPVSVTPSHLLLMPGRHSFEIMVDGGPFSLNIPEYSKESKLTFTVVDGPKSLIELSDINTRFPRVTTTLSTGECTIRIETSGTAPSVRSSVDVKIVVDVPHRVKIVLPSEYSTILGERSHYKVNLSSSQSQMFMVALLTADGRMFSMPHVLMPSGETSQPPADIDSPERCEFEWKISSPHLIQLKALSLNGIITGSSLTGVGLSSVHVMAGSSSGFATLSVTVSCGRSSSKPLLSWGSKPSLQRKPVFSFHGTAEIEIALKPDFDSFRHQTFERCLSATQPNEHSLNREHVGRVPTVIRLAPHGIYRLAPEMAIGSETFLEATLLQRQLNGSFQEMQRLNSSGVFGHNEHLQIRSACGGSCIELYAGSSHTHDWILNLMMVEAKKYLGTISVPVVIASVCSCSLDSSWSILNVGSSSTALISLRDCQGRAMLIPTNMRILTLSSHPSVIEAQHHLETVEGHAVSSIVSRIALNGWKRGCAGLGISVYPPLPDSETGETTPLVSAARFCVDSALLPTDSVLHLAAGGLARAVVDPERLQDNPIKLALQMRIFSDAVLSEIRDMLQCPGDMEDVGDGCALWSFTQKQQLPKWAAHCKIKKVLSMASVEIALSERLGSEIRSIFQHVFGDGAGWSFTTAVAIESTVDSEWMLTEFACPHHKTGLNVSVNVSIEKEVLTVIKNQLSKSSAISSLLNSVWNIIAYPPSSISLRILKRLDWSLGIYLVSQKNFEGWMSDNSSLTVSSDGHISSDKAVMGHITLQTKDVTGILNVHVHQIDRLCNIVLKDTLEVVPWSQICVTEHTKPLTKNNVGFLPLFPLDRTITLPFIVKAQEETLFTSPFTSQRLEVTCTPENPVFFKLFRFFSTHTPIRYQSDFVRSSPACRLVPHKVQYREIAELDLPSQIELKVSVHPKALQTIRIFKFTASISAPIVVDDTQLPFRAIESLPKPLVKSVEKLEGRKTRPLVLTRKLAYPVTFHIWTGGHQVDLSSDDIDTSIFTASISSAASTPTMTIKLSWKEAINWQQHSSNFPYEKAVEEISLWAFIRNLFYSSQECSSKYSPSPKPFISVIKPTSSLLISSNLTRITVPIIFAEVAGVAEAHGHNIIISGRGGKVSTLFHYEDNSSFVTVASIIRSVGTAVGAIIALFVGVIIYDYMKSQAKRRTVEIPAGVARLSPSRPSHSSLGTPTAQSTPGRPRTDYGTGGYLNSSPSPRFLNRDCWTDFRQRRRLSQEWD